MVHFATLILSFVFGFVNPAASEVYYITTGPRDPSCPGRCLTLSQFATNISHLLDPNTTLIFLPGTHHLNSTVLKIANLDYFAMQSENSTAHIVCENYSSVHFNHSQCIEITNLEFIGCGENHVQSVVEFVVQDTTFKGKEYGGTALILIETTAQVVNSTFMSNRGSFRKCVLYDPDDGCYGDGFIGGAIIATNCTVDINQSEFEDNGADLGGAIFAEQNSIITMSNSAFIEHYVTFVGGVLYSNSSSITIEVSEFYGNDAIYLGAVGGAIFAFNNTIEISFSKFENNSAEDSGGAIFAVQSSIIDMNHNVFSHNSAFWGGGISSKSSAVLIKASEFHHNYADIGGVLYSSNSTFAIVKSRFHSNTGGALALYTSAVSIETSMFYDNNGGDGGVIFSANFSIDANGSTSTVGQHSCTIKIKACKFYDNWASSQGGVLESSNCAITIIGSNFTNNFSPVWSIIFAGKGSKIHHSNLLIDMNLAEYSVLYIFDSEFKEQHDSKNFTFSSNLGSLLAFSSNVTFVSYVVFANNQPAPKNYTGNFREGGAITLFQSTVFFDGTCSLEHNHADSGGAIHSIDSKIYVDGIVAISYNTASKDGGGAYLLSSELNCQQSSNFTLFGNTAGEKGGGVHAVSSTIKAASALVWPQYTGTRINFTNNSAKWGGGLSLSANAKLYILKYDGIASVDSDHKDYLTCDTNTTVLIANSAEYGGAVYVDDDSNSGSCANPKTECFFQVFGLYNLVSPGTKGIKIQSIYFSLNYASILGSTLYGGLLDRCAVSPFAEVYMYSDVSGDTNGLTYFKNVSIPTYYYVENTTDHDVPVPTNLSIASGPVQVCLCTNTTHNCIHESYIEVKKGETFTKSLLAVDQTGQPVNATIQSSLNYSDSGLAEGQLSRKIHPECTNLTFNIVSKHNSEILILYALDGPCKDAELSTAIINVYFLNCTCPIGLQVSGMNKMNCTCECHRNISQYVGKCDSDTGSLVKQPQSRVWISYINETGLTGYLIYPNCPFDYCLLTSPPIDLNQPNGADAQCAFNRSSLLCGSCQPGLSLSLGSSCCLPCPSYWPALLVAITIAAILAGIALVALLLVLNMTVAVGTLNGLIFYANVVHYANENILLSFENTNFVTVFISWLNLEVGIDTCYFPGMDTYIKTWLDLVFPTYVILLVVLVIMICSYSSKFSNLIGKKNPVATLATLILLSYAKFLEVCFKALSVGILESPDKRSSEMLWLPDATVKYLSGKHIPLFIAAVLILLVGLVYTALLFSWQCFLRLPQWRIFGWSRNPKIQTFIETYHTPYNPKHRYWTGLLLIIRIILYLIAAANVSNDPTIALTAIIFMVCCIVLLKGLIGSRLQKNVLTDLLETFFYFNILFFAIFSSYSLDSKYIHQEAITNTSVIAAIIVSLLIILCHIYTNTRVFSRVKKTRFGKMIDWLFVNRDPKPAPRLRSYSPPPDDDIHRFDELLNELDCPVNTDDYNTAPLLRPAPLEPTFSVVQVHKPNLAS